MIATTAYLISMLVDRGVGLKVASASLGVMGLGKVAGRLLLLGPVGRQSLTALAAICTAIQLAGLALPLGVTGTGVLFPAMFVVGCASGATTVLRPLIVIELVGAAPFAGHQCPHPTCLDDCARRGTAGARCRRHRTRLADRMGRLPGRVRGRRRALRRARTIRPLRA